MDSQIKFHIIFICPEILFFNCIFHPFKNIKKIHGSQARKKVGAEEPVLVCGP